MHKIECINLRKIQQQHNSLVVVIPPMVRSALELAPGDYVVFGPHDESGKAEFCKFIMKGSKDAENSRDAD